VDFQKNYTIIISFYTQQ